MEKESLSIELNEGMKEAEEAFAKAYTEVEPEVRALLIERIPLKIIFRLNARIQKIKEEEEKKSSKKKSEPGAALGSGSGSG